MTSAVASRKSCLLAILLILTVLTVGCNSDFFLGESEANAYLANLRTEPLANELLSGLSGKELQLHFNVSGGVPHLSQSNLLEVLRGTKLGVIESQLLQQQISLETLAKQIEGMLDGWISDRLLLLKDQAGSKVNLSELDRATVKFVSAPQLQYSADQRIQFAAKLQITIAATIDVNVLSGVESFVASLFGANPNGRYPLTITLDNWQLNGSLSFSSSFVDAATLHLQMPPSSPVVTVRDTTAVNAPDRIKAGVRQAFEKPLAGAVDETLDLKFDYFSIAALQLLANNTTSQRELSFSYEPRPCLPEPILDVVARTSGGRLYHARKIDGAWRDVEVLPPIRGPLSDPALVASTPDQLDVVATAGGVLFHSSYRQKLWTNRIIDGAGTERTEYFGRPALLSTAPGQLEVIATQRDGLYHLRRVNGAWQSPVYVNVGIAPRNEFRDPVVVQAGNKLLLLFVDRLNSLYVIAFDLDSARWGKSVYVANTMFAPAAVSSGDGRIDIVYVKPNGVPSHLVAQVNAATILDQNDPGFWSRSGLAIGGLLNESPALVASGYQRLELVGRGTDNHLYHNHLVASNDPTGLVEGVQVSSGWTGWSDISYRFFGSGDLFAGQIGGPAVASTRAGEVYVVGRERFLQADRGIFGNSYHSTRYGIAPWKAMRWRGFQKIGSQNFTGYPALSVSDQQLTVAVAGQNGDIWNSNLDANYVAKLSNVPSIRAGASNGSKGPLIFSSGPGIVDILTLGPNGEFQQRRRLNGILDRSIAIPSNFLFKAIAAQSYGDGYIDMVGVAFNNTLSYWRLRNGRWEGPGSIGGNVISPPVLLNTGAGQLSLLGIGGDHQLYLWRFTNGRWSNWYQISSNVLVDENLFGQSAAASWGDGEIDLVSVEAGSRRMFHRRILAGMVSTGAISNREVSSVGGVVADVPMLTALAPFSLHILVQGTDSRLYSTWSFMESPSSTSRRGDDGREGSAMSVVPRFRVGWRASQPVSWPGLVGGGVTLLGERTLVSIATGPDGRTYLSRYKNLNWSGYRSLIERNQPVRQGTASIRPAATIN